MQDDAGKERGEASTERSRDGDAVRRVLSGELAGFDELIEAYQRRAVAVSYRLLGNINDAMDVCQDAYVKAYRSLSTLDEPEKFGSWLMRIVSNLSLNFRRDRSRRATLSLATGEDDVGVGEDAVAAAGGSGRQGGDSAMSSETEEAISAAIEQLPQKQRLALVLFAIEGLPQKEVAEILECSIELVKWNVFQARKALKESLAEYLVS